MFVGLQRKTQHIEKKKPPHWHKYASLQAAVVGGWKAKAEREVGGIGSGELRETQQYETCHGMTGVLTTSCIDGQTVQLFGAVGYILGARGKYSRAEIFATPVPPRLVPTVDEVGLLGSLKAFLHRSW